MHDDEMEIDEEFPCENYTGVEYPIHSDVIDFVAPDNQVALTSITYVQGVGMNARVVSVPGSDHAMFFEETEAFGICGCAPPSVWLFTGVKADGSVHIVHILSVHDAVHLLRHPDHIFDGSINHVGAMSDKLSFVPAEDGVDLVFRETQDHLTRMGVPDLQDPKGLKYDDVRGTDIDDMISKFFEKRDDK